METARAVPRAPGAHPEPQPRETHTAQKTHKASESRAIQPEPRHLAAAEGDVFDAKCLALAERGELTRAARWFSLHELAEGWRPVETFTVPSGSRAGLAHTLTYLPGRQALRCTCEAATLGNQPCGHRGAALMLIHTLDDLMADARTLARQVAALNGPSESSSGSAAEADTARASADLRERMHAEDIERAQGQTQVRRAEHRLVDAGTTYGGDSGEGWW